MESDPLSLVRAAITDAFVEVELSDGRRLSTPLAWYPKLQNASREQREKYEVWPWGLHWPFLDEDLSLDGMVMGQRSVSAIPQATGTEQLPIPLSNNSLDANRIGLHNGLVDFPALKRPING